MSDDLDQRRLDVRSRHEDRSRDGADHTSAAPVGDLHADGAVRRGAGRGGKPLGHLALDHDEDALHLGDEIEDVADERCRDVVRQVGDEHPVVDVRVVAARQNIGPLQMHRVALDHVDVRPICHDLSEDGDDAPIDLDRGDVSAGVGERQRQRTQACTDLDDPVAGTHARQRRDAPDRVRVGDEVLTEVTSRCEVVAAQQFGDARSRMRHRRISTGIGASVRSAISVNRSTSITRSSRCVAGANETRQVVVRLLSKLTTVTGSSVHLPTPVERWQQR